MSYIRRYLIAGLLVWLPIWVTILVFKFLIDAMDNTLALIPAEYQPDKLLGFHIPALGAIISITVLFLTGVMVSNFLGRQLVALGDFILTRIPLVRSVYTATKQVLDTIFSSKGQAFRKVLLVEYPRKGMWSIAFQTGQGSKELNASINSELVTIFIPTTPNPTSGFLMMVPRSDVIELEMSVDEALKFVISLGVIQPDMKKISKSTAAAHPEDVE